MDKRKDHRTRWIILLILALSAVCAPSAVVIVQRRQSLQKDLDTTKTIASVFGYNDQNYLNINRVYGWSNVDFITLDFYSEVTYAEMPDRIEALGFKVKFYFLHDTGFENEGYAEYINKGKTRGLITLDNHERGHEGDAKAMYPKVTSWDLIDLQGRRIDIRYAQPRYPGGTWLLDGKPIAGNMIRVIFNRKFSLWPVLIFPFENAGTLSEP